MAKNQRKAKAVILRANNCALKATCALCGGENREDVPLAAYIEGTNAWVCLPCFQNHTGIPGAAQLLDYANGYLAHGNKDGQQLKKFLCNIDSLDADAADAANDGRASRLQDIARELWKLGGEFHARLSQRYCRVMTDTYGGTCSKPDDRGELPPF